MPAKFLFLTSSLPSGCDSFCAPFKSKSRSSTHLACAYSKTCQAIKETRKPHHFLPSLVKYNNSPGRSPPENRAVAGSVAVAGREEPGGQSRHLVTKMQAILASLVPTCTAAHLKDNSRVLICAVILSL